MLNYCYSYKEILDIMKRGIMGRNQSYAYILFGYHGIGKSHISSRIAEQIVTSEPIGMIEHNYLQSPDLYTLDHNPANDNALISIDIIRNIKHWIKHTTVNSGHKIIVIDDIDRMNINAQNAFLKILEEPIGNTIYIMNTSYINLVSDTIKSRSIKIRIKKISFKDFKSIIFELSGCNTQDYLKILYEVCNGDINLAIELIGNSKLNYFVDLYSHAKYSRIMDTMCTLDIEVNLQLRFFKCLISKLMSKAINQSFQNQAKMLLLSKSFSKIQYIFMNLPMLNKKHSKRLIISYLNNCLLI